MSYATCCMDPVVEDLWQPLPFLNNMLRFSLLVSSPRLATGKLPPLPNHRDSLSTYQTLKPL